MCSSKNFRISLLALAVLPRFTTVTPDFLFSREAKWVTFELEAKELSPADGARLELIEVASDGSKKRTLGPLIDEGVFGDKKKGDQVYSRRFKLTEETPGLRVFEARVGGRPLSPPGRLELEVVARPTFQEAVRSAWKRVFHKSN